MSEIIILTLAFTIDRIIGDPENFPHPVRWIGSIIAGGETFYRKRIKEEKAAGILLTVSIVSCTYIFFYTINMLYYDHNRSPLLSFILFMSILYFTFTLLATGELARSALSVIDALDRDNIPDARNKLGMIVGRDTSSLERHDIKKATIETVAENASDGIIAPLFYFSLGGLPLAMAYKAINTLDSMVGYKNDRYRDFGWASARLDDIANYIPARITGLLIIIAAFIIRKLKGLDRGHFLSWSRALHIMVRDGRNHTSPNSGMPEAAMAGALGIKLGGPSTYKGIVVNKPYIGEDLSDADAEYERTPRESVAVVKMVACLGLGCAIAVLIIRNTI
jgi:adenosylcobinamide-phosphate synthase